MNDTKYVQCKECSGSGLIKNSKICKNCNGKRCYKCDYKGPFQNYEECKKCLSSGKILIIKEKKD